MTSEDVKSELEKEPFGGVRLHLVSGKTIDVVGPGQAVMLRNCVMILNVHHRDMYDMVDMRNIERIERMETP